MNLNSGGVSPMNAIRRWPSSIRWRVASSPPPKSSITTLGNAECWASTRTHGAPAARRRATSASGGKVDTISRPSARSPRPNSSKACRCRSSDSTSKSITSYSDSATAATIPRTRSTADGLVNHGRTTATTIVLPSERLRARELGRKSSSAIASSTRARVVGRTFECPFRTRETVATPTPALVATSTIVARVGGSASIRCLTLAENTRLRKRQCLDEEAEPRLRSRVDAVPQRCQEGGHSRYTLSGAAPAGGRVGSFVLLSHEEGNTLKFHGK